MELQLIERCRILPTNSYHFLCPVTELNKRSYSETPEYRSDPPQQFNDRLKSTSLNFYSHRMIQPRSEDEIIERFLRDLNFDFNPNHDGENTALKCNLSSSGSSLLQTDSGNVAECLGSRTVQNSLSLTRNRMQQLETIEEEVLLASRHSENDQLGLEETCHRSTNFGTAHEQQCYQDIFRDPAESEENHEVLPLKGNLLTFDSGAEKVMEVFDDVKIVNTQLDTSIIETIPVHKPIPILPQNPNNSSLSITELANHELPWTIAEDTTTASTEDNHFSLNQEQDYESLISTFEEEFANNESSPTFTTISASERDNSVSSEEQNEEDTSSCFKQKLLNNSQAVPDRTLTAPGITTKTSSTEDPLCLNLDSNVSCIQQSNGNAIESSNLIQAEVSQSHSSLDQIGNFGETNILNSALLTINWQTSESPFPFDIIINDLKTFESKIDIFNPDVMDCSIVNMGALEKTLKALPYSNKTHLKASSSAVEFNAKDNWKKFFCFNEFKSTDFLKERVDALPILAIEQKYKPLALNPSMNVTNFRAELQFPTLCFKTTADEEGQRSIEAETEISVDRDFEFEECLFDILDDEDDSLLHYLSDDDDLSSYSDFEPIEDSDYVHSSIVTENSSYPMVNFLHNGMSLTDENVNNKSIESPMKEKNRADVVLFDDLPVILKYINDDTAETEEMLLYPKDYLDNFLKAQGGKQLTRHEILGALIDRSKIYDGKPIGIVSNIRETRMLLTKNKTIEQCPSKFKNCGDSEMEPRRLGDDSSIVRDQDERSETSRSSPNQLERGSQTSVSSVCKSPALHSNCSATPTNGISAKSRSKWSRSHPEPYYQCQNQSDALNNEDNHSDCQYPKNKHTNASVTKRNATHSDTRYGIKQKATSWHISRPQSSTPIVSSKSQTTPRSATCNRSSLSLSMKGSQKVRSKDYPVGNIGRNNVCDPKQRQWTSSMRKRSSRNDDASFVAQPNWKKRINVEEVVASDFKSFFNFYAKLRGRLKSGSVISKANSNYWFRKTGVVFDDQSVKLAEECFDEVARKKLVLNIYDYMKYLTAISRRKKQSLSDLVQQLKSVEMAELLQSKKVSCAEISITDVRNSYHLPSTTNQNLLNENRALARTPYTYRASRIPVSLKKLQAK